MGLEPGCLSVQNSLITCPEHPIRIVVVLKRFCKVVRTKHDVIAEKMNNAFLELIFWH